MKTFVVVKIFASISLLILTMHAQTYDLHFSTYIGGTNIDQMRDMNVDTSGNIYITGGTESANFPVTPGAYDTTHNITVDSNGIVYFGGDTYSTNYPVTPDAYQSTNAGLQDGILVKVKADFTDVLYSTYFGGSADDGSRCSVLDYGGGFYYGGWTQSTDFPLQNPWQDTLVGNWDLGLAKFIPTSSVDEKINSEKESHFCLKSSNPSKELMISYSLETPCLVKLVLYDCIGRIAHELTEFRNRGTHNVKIKTNNLESGVYFLRFKTETASIAKKLILVK